MVGESEPKVRASGLFLDERGVLLGRHVGHEFYTLIGGSWEYGETLEEAVEREFLEETGMRVHASQLLFVAQLHTTNEHVLDMIFRVSSATGREDAVREESGSLLDLHFVPIQELTRTNLEPQEFWKIWIPRLMNDQNEAYFAYGGVYDR
jgi:ADP-ribose pyrophosphatase YjhB (NUDIX family)